MKTLVVCCDGTWKRADDVDVSNIEKIARAVAPVDADGKPQIVYYRAGVGTGGSKTERLVGGAFGIGLDSAIVDAYRFLALNYEKGDKVYVFGFSRGAYTARSLVGMIATIGLLKPKGVASGKLPKALKLYRERPRRKSGFDPGFRGNPEWDKENEEFAPFCHEPVPIAFLGVFDTVGALGAPGPTRRRYRFHDVRLSEQVLVARQALAAAERRRAFAPCLWGRINADGGSRDVVQVWFDGVHSDVGGGYENCVLGDRTLAWMVTEATKTGLAFDLDRIVPNRCQLDEEAHNSLTVFYRIANVFSRFAAAYGRRMPSDLLKRFRRGWRNFAPMVDPVDADEIQRWEQQYEEAVPAERAVMTKPRPDDGRAWCVLLAQPALDRLGGAKRWPVNPNMTVWLDELAECGATPQDIAVSVPTLADLSVDHRETGSAAG
ncbi:DUF2235 domain-containing protein [Gordonia sp. (in: high G+C Gram-positive bacteria)]|uniref:DUF2235 domain-containing protein n=2 Tax=Gordonia sp. (in: high G+C Gram-positive bacteria) TaxID=84139 RepID=UPI00261F146A|nr:DUF2235 domain-containing protein [Gordonia sp. (in: high G+C Gram-positive bacteria)]HMS74505.1 DUF2235 domain-containing protein [Gordonia sp. (in: high G+C Gram-positive bacteria)]